MCQTTEVYGNEHDVRFWQVAQWVWLAGPLLRIHNLGGKFHKGGLFDTNKSWQ